MAKSRDDFGKDYIEPRDCQLTKGQVIIADFKAVSTALEPDSPVPCAVALILTVDFLSMPVVARIKSPADLDSLIECLIAARNHVWP